MKNQIYYHSSTMKRVLIFVAIVLIFSLLFSTQKIVNDLRDDSTKLMNFYAEVYVDAIAYPGSDFSFVFSKIIQNISIPLILSQEKDSLVTTWKNLPVENNNASSTDSLKVLKIMRKMDKENKPIRLSYEEKTLAYIHYGDTELIGKLQMLPFIEIGVVALFIFLGYFGFQQIRSSEKSSIWAGMAKETAHQLGTPISSLMGWVAILESEYADNENIYEMKQDIDRLTKVTNRFSKIGSEPVLIKTELSGVIKEAIKYYKKRLPQLDKKVKLIYSTENKIYGIVNADIFSWALENIIKNSIDAIGNKDGEVKIVAYNNKEDEKINIDISDTGKGIEKKNWNNIFRPGYSTKSRGWGLGLSLTKRIIDKYHNGNIFVKNSRVGKGTTIQISIPNKKND